MLIQVVHSHPLTDSYNHALFRIIVDQLRERHQVIATDLYRERFSPVMTEPERRSYYQPPYVEEEVAPLVRQLRQADGIIFCFPHWWFSMPAMLKGYFDRVWAPGTAFAHDLNGGRIEPLLTNIKLFGVVTTYGSPWWLTRIVMQDPGRKVLFRALKPMCGPGVRSFYLAHYDMDRSTPASRQAFAERVRTKIAGL
jgi:NAD(P)H dehydrogenase (quinone)